MSPDIKILGSVLFEGIFDWVYQVTSGSFTTVCLFTSLSHTSTVMGLSYRATVDIVAKTKTVMTVETGKRK